MQMTDFATNRSRARDAAGFTLIEILVAMTSAIIVMGALFAVFLVALHQSSKIADASQATQAGRTTMAKITDELQSACLAPEFTPVLEKSTPTTLRFINAYSRESVIPKAYLHEIVWTGTAPNPGKLIDYSRASASSSVWPNFTSSSSWEAISPAGGTVLGEHIYETEVEVAGKKQPVPIFKYYKYATKSSSTSESSSVATLSPLTLEVEKEKLTSAEAKEAASVLVSLTAAPANNYTKGGRIAEFSNQVTFAFTAPASEATVKGGPCQ